ncbi:MAG: hypothetical protein WHT09_13405 [Thermogutta sp.]
MSYNYTITASCSGGQWSKAGNATLHENGSADYSHTGTGTYAASGSNSTSSSGSGSGSGMPFEFEWSYGGSFSETATQTSSYQGTTHFSLASEGTWQATAGTLSGSSSATWSYSASGAYAFSFDGGSTHGSFSASGSDGFSYEYSISASGFGGGWTESGTASLTQTGSATATYSGSGSFAMSGQASASGSSSGYSWNCSGTISENGSDHSSYTAVTQLVLDTQGGWQATTGGASGSGTNEWSYTWEGSYSYRGDGVSMDGNFTDSTTDTFSYDFELTGSYSEGQWDETGTASVTSSGQNSVSYSETGTLALAGEGWTLTANVSRSGSQDASWSYGLGLELDSTGNWQAAGGSGGSSGMGEVHESVHGTGTYSYPVGGGNITGTFTLSSNQHVSPYMFTTSAIYENGQWSETGSAWAIAAGGGNNTYTGLGTFGASGDSWNTSVSVSENGNDAYMYQYTLGYVLDDQGAWNLDTASGGSSGNGLLNRYHSSDGSYWYTVGLTTVTGDVSEFAEGHVTYSYTTTDSALGGVWTHSGFGTWDDQGRGNRAFSAESPYFTADGYSGTVQETGYESFNYHYTGNPALATEGNWYWATGSGQASGNGHWTFNRTGSKPYSRTDGSTYSVTGTKSENITDQLSYSYTTSAAVNGQGLWVVNGGATAQASGQATWNYSGSGSFSSSSGSPGVSTTYNATTSENGSTGSGYNFSLEFELVDGVWVPTTGQGTVTAAREEHFSHTGTRQSNEQANWSNSGGSGNRTESRTLTQGQTKDLTYQRIDHYMWMLGSASGSGSGSASGSASSPWRLTQIQESGNAAATRQLDYGYSGSGWSQAQWGDAFAGGSSSSSWYAIRSIHQESHSTETLNRTVTFNTSGQAASSGTNVRTVSATGSADSFYDSQWEDHWWLDAETRASGGTWQNATYDDYNYQYQWTKTWQGQGDGAVTSSASNHVTGLENGFESGWWMHTVPEGSGSGSSSSTSWGAPWDDSYDTTVSYPGFSEARYYGRDYGGGSGEEDYIAYIGDAFSETSPPGSGGTLFPFAYGGEELGLALAQSGDSESAASSPTVAQRAGSTAEQSGKAELAAASPRTEADVITNSQASTQTLPPAPPREYKFFYKNIWGTWKFNWPNWLPRPETQIDETFTARDVVQFGCGGLAAVRAGSRNAYVHMTKREGVRCFTSYGEAYQYLKQLQDSGQPALLVVIQSTNPLRPLTETDAEGRPKYVDFGPETTRVDPRRIDVEGKIRNFASLIMTKGGYAWEYANHGVHAARDTGVPFEIHHKRKLPDIRYNVYCVIPGSLTSSPLVPIEQFPQGFEPPPYDTGGQ